MSHSFSHIGHKADGKQLRSNLIYKDLTGTDYFKDKVDPWKNWVFVFSAKPKKEVVSGITAY